MQNNFLSLVQQSYFAFEQNIEQIRLIQIQESLMGRFLQYIENNAALKDIPELCVYHQNNTTLRNMGKTYQNIIFEKIFTDGYRVFEEYLHGIFSALFNCYPHYLLGADNAKEKIEAPFDTIFILSDLEACKAIVIENKVKSYLQSETIKKVLKKFSDFFKLKIEISDRDMELCQRISLIRNVITHNNGKINAIYMQGVKAHKIQNDTYRENDGIHQNLATEINLQQEILLKIARQLKKDLESQNNILKLQKYSDSRNA